MKLSPNMVDALDVLEKAGALHRYDGGYWAEPNAPLGRNGVPQHGHFGTNTVRSLIDRGLVHVTGYRDGNYSPDANNYAVKVERTDMAYS